MYFDVAKWSYLQFGVLVPYMALGPTIVSATITLGVMQFALAQTIHHLYKNV